MRSKKEAYRTEREQAINALSYYAHRLENTLDKWADTAGFVDEETGACVQAYAAAETALLKLLKEESEE